MNLRFGLGVAAICAVAGSTAMAQAPDPFANNDGAVPPPSEYKGPLFQLSHDYPPAPAPQPKEVPWRKAINNGPITVENAEAYTLALKQYIAADMRVLFNDYAAWNAGALGWYNEPWLGGIRESIHGTYVGSEDFPAALFAQSGLTKDFTTYVLTYYDRTAANTLTTLWGQTAMKPNITTAATQFMENSIVVKAALTTANADVWPAMQGALQWPLYITVNATTGNHKTPQVDNTSLMQFDVVVKDTQSAPKSGWVFATLVYDKDAPGKDIWDKMVPLGAMWGNDPDVNSAKDPKATLKENWINPKAPGYSTATLGWGGRLSGPNDGALNDAAFVTPGGTKKVQNTPSSSCLSCHGVAEWSMKSFLLPTTTLPPKVLDNDYLVMWTPGSPQWMRWFQSRPGNKPQDPGTVALDYDMVFAFKSLPAWQKATGKGTAPVLALRKNGKPVPSAELQYNGLPFVAPQ